eukprot:1266867-Alexandrium_andersonii.AAC.1
MPIDVHLPIISLETDKRARVPSEGRPAHASNSLTKNTSGPLCALSPRAGKKIWPRVATPPAQRRRLEHR